MSKIALYRKYRPQNFVSVIGQSFIVKTLLLSNQKKNLFHAYIFSGPRGTGKTSMAKIFAKTINCLSPNNGDACNKCENCLEVLNNQAIDLIELDAASNNGVNEIRSIIETVSYLPNKFHKKIYIIDEAHMLSTSAWNALLKTIEEPPEHVIFIFATTEFNKIPLTILSRCQRYDFQKLNHDELRDLILRVSQNEKIALEDQAIDKLILLSDGAARDCLSILDQLSSVANDKIDEQIINMVFGLSTLANKIDFLKALNNADLDLALSILNDLLSKGLNGLEFCKELLLILVDCLVYLKTKNKNLLKKITVNNFEDLHLNLNILLRWIDFVNQTYSDIKKFNNTTFYLEILVFKLIDFEKSDDQKFSDKTEKKVIEKSVKKTNNEVQVSSNPNVNDIFKTSEWSFGLNQEQSDDKNSDELVDESKPVINPYLSKSKQSSSTKNEQKEPNVIDKSLLSKSSNPKASNETAFLDNDQKPSGIIKKIDLKFDYQDLFIKIAANNISSSKKTFAEKLQKFLEDELNYEDDNLKILTEIKKVYAASENGVVLIFKYEMFSERFNDLFKHVDFYQSLKKIFEHDYFIIGVSEKEGKEYLTYAKENIKNKNEIKDVNINQIQTLINQTDSVIQNKLLNLLSDKIKKD